MSSTPPRSQIRLYAVTGSISDISSVANQRAAQPASAIAAENLHDILGHMAGAITRIHGSASFTEAAAGVFTHDEATFTGDVKVKGGDLKTDALVASIFDTNADTVLIGGEAELIQFGANSGLSEFAGDVRVSGSIEMVGSGMELIDRVGGALKIRGGDLTGSAGKVMVELSGSELHMQDGYAVDAGWSGAISLADSSTDWSRFKSVFGEASILSAISTAAALPADARFLYKVTNAESGVTALSGSQLRQVDGTHFSASFAAVPAASRNENIDVFLNGQLLVSKSYNAGDYDYDIAADGTSVSFNFGLQPDDFVSILVPVTVASVAEYIGSNGIGGGGGGGGGGTGATGPQGPAGATGATGPAGSYDIGGSVAGRPASSEIIFRAPLSHATTLTSGIAYCETAPTSAVALDIQKGVVTSGSISYSSVGTIDYTSGSVVGSVTLTGNSLSLSTGNILRIVAPSSQDVTFASPTFSFSGSEA